VPNLWRLGELMRPVISRQLATNTGFPLEAHRRQAPRGHCLPSEKAVELLLMSAAAFGVIALAAIAVFVFAQGLPFLMDIGIVGFVTGAQWDPTADEPAYGILPMIAGSALATLGALVLGVPLGLACAVFIAETAPKRIASLLRPAVELLAGIPSVVYGFFGLVVVVPFIRSVFDAAMGGYSILAGSTILAIMILPTVVSVSEEAISSVPVMYREGSLALGATHWQTIARVILPAAKSGIAAGVILAMGRAIGETMAVMMVMGGVKAMPGGHLPDGLLKPLLVFLEPGRTMTATIAMEMGYADPVHKQALFAIGTVLFGIVFALNIVVNTALKGKRPRP
jgi:phosphate transport system permease protein